MLRRRARSERGTSLLEVVVTVALLTGGVMASVGTIDAVKNATSSLDRRERALELASSSMEQIRSLPYSEVGISPSSLGFVSSFEGHDTVRVVGSAVPARRDEVIGLDTFRVTQHVTWGSVTLSSGSALAATWKRLTVIVSFDGSSRQVRVDGGLSPVAPAIECANRAVDSAAGPLTGVVNTYLAGSAPSVAGATVLTVTEPARLGSAAPITTGDLVLVMQMTSTPGGSAGTYEYALATSPVRSGRLGVTGLGLGGGLINAYGVDGLFQVVRVPTFASATAGVGLSALPWDGSTGGVLAIDATEGLTLAAPLANDRTGFDTERTPGVTLSSTRLLPGGAASGRGGGLTLIRTAALVGTAPITADGDGDGGSIGIVIERGDLSATTVFARGDTASGGTLLANSSVGTIDLAGAPPGSLDTTLGSSWTTGVPLGVGCLPAVNTVVSTSTPAVARAAGVTIGYHIFVTNAPGRAIAENVAVRDFLPTGFGLTSTPLIRLGGGATRDTVTDPTPGTSSPQWSTFTLPPGGSVAIYLTVALPVGTPLTAINNEAATTYTASGTTWTSVFAGNSWTFDDVVIVG